MDILCIFLALILLLMGLTKIARIPALRKYFRRRNLTTRVMVAIGLLEVIAGVSLSFHHTHVIGLGVTIFILLGTTIFCWVSGDNWRSLFPLACLVVANWLVGQSISDASLARTIGLSQIFIALSAAFLWLYTSTPNNEDGEEEELADGTIVTHHFRKVLDVRYHYVTGGKKGQETIVLIPGAPESWYCWHQQIMVLSNYFQIIAIDLKPYGQTGKDMDGDHSYPHIAKEIAALLEVIGVEDFHLAGHDRGAVVTAHMLSLPVMAGRVRSYVRMQQSFNEPHGEPVPPHRLMGSFIGTLAFKIRFGMWFLYTKSYFSSFPLAPAIVRRIGREFRFHGIAQAVPQSFKTTSFAKELRDRHEHLFQFMNMPVLLLQGRLDPGQHPEEYAEAHLFAPNLRVKFIEANHFFHLEAPEETNQAIFEFLQSIKSYGA